MDFIKEEGFEELTTIQTIKLYTGAAVQNNYSFALWKLPNETAKHFIVDVSGRENLVKPDLNHLAPGFLISPFINEDNKQTTYLRADLHYQFHNDKIKGSFASSSAAVNTAPFEKALAYLKEDTFSKPKYYTSAQATASSEKESFIQLVEHAIENIQQEKLEKLVPSKTKLVALSENFDYLDGFLKLCEAYPHAMVSVIATPKLGTWIGASPEKLVSMNKDGIFKTVSLAGTQKVPPAIDPTTKVTSQASWTQKEIEEQALVSRYIINCFKKIRLREYDERGPKTIKAGNLMHLNTEFTVDTKSVGFPELATVMLELLHPTSAVCGMPRQASLDFLKAHEGFDRKLYSGYLGPVNIAGGTNLFVNLRCMQLLNRQAAVYAGAGVTADSDPEKEWLETELKCETLLNVLAEDL